MPKPSRFPVDALTTVCVSLLTLAYRGGIAMSAGRQFAYPSSRVVPRIFVSMIRFRRLAVGSFWATLAWWVYNLDHKDLLLTRRCRPTGFRLVGAF